MRKTESGLALASLICVVAAIAATGPAAAQQGTTRLSGLTLNGKDPIQIESDALEVLDEQSKAIFSGNVTVNQGPTLLKAGKMTVFYVRDDKKPASDAAAAPAAASAISGASNIDHIEVDDKVYIKSNTQVATGDKGTFDMATQMLTLSGGQVVLSDGPNVLVGCKLTANLKTGRAQVDGCGKGGRVQMSITPGSQPGAPKP